MTPNELLLWLSARKEGSWPQFRGAVETLDLANQGEEGESDGSLPLHLRVCFNLERLGHVEFDANECEDGWRIVPPTLALSQHHDKVTGVLCGARTPKLLSRIVQSLNGLSLERTAQRDSPDVIRMSAPDAGVLMELAKQAGISCQPDAPTALLSHLPLVDSLTGWHRDTLPNAGRDWEVKQFVIEKKVVRWRPLTIQEANAPGAQGLFRFTRYQIPHYFLREGNETIKISGAIGKYHVLSRRQRRVLKYSRKQCSLTLPAVYRPPLLTERALILCSGFPPAFSFVRERPTLEYRDIPEEVAGMTAEVLKQDFL